MLAAAAPLASVQDARSLDRPIQPGARMTVPAGCTLNFVFTDGVEPYIGTAGHCTNAVGERVASPDIGAFGTVVFRRDRGPDDFALIRIDPGLDAMIDPATRSFDGPTGVVSHSETTTGDLVGLSGYGMGFRSAGQTRARTGVLTSQSAERFTAALPAVFGDSGGPVVHLASGAALGIVSGIGPTVPPSTLLGTTVERALWLANDAGFSVQLVTIQP